MKRIINNLFSEFLPNYNILLLFAQFFWLVVFIVLKAPISYILTATLIIIVDIGICNSYVEKKKKEHSEDLKSLEKEYSNYISLVNKNIDDISKKIATRTKIELKILDENYYLFNLAKNLEMMKGYKASDKLNTFIEASCFMFAFVNSRKMIVKDKSKNIRVSAIEDGLNIYVALNTVLEIISEPTLYLKGESKTFNKIENMSVPSLTQDGDTLYTDIATSFLLSYNKADYSSIMHFANLLHLLYLYNKVSS